MKNQNDQLERLAEALTSLLDLVPETRDDLQHWYDEAQLILESPDLLKGAPHFLWHYLSDADIRMKSPEYAEMQNRRINLLIERLKEGVMPHDKDT